MWNYITVIFGEHKYFSSTVVVKNCKICTDKISRLKNEKKKEKKARNITYATATLGYAEIFLSIQFHY